MLVKVWLGGEGSCEVGTRADGGDQPGVIEALLRRVASTGWTVGGAQRWKYIHKYRAGQALRGGENHGDIHNVIGLVFTAWENACEVVAFTRDADADDRRTAAIERGIAAAKTVVPDVLVIGGIAKPAIEGWLLALLGMRDTDSMSRERTLEELRRKGLPEKQPVAYVELVEHAELEGIAVGCDTFTTWLDRARTNLARAIHGELIAPLT
jgi:hypothetical protein